MRTYLYLGLILFSLVGCAQKHQINIGEISIQKHDSMPKKSSEYYMSFTQEYYDDKLYPVSEYCNDKRAYLSDDKFSTETYLKLTNERTRQSRVGKYPIWFLLNDDASNISCVKKSANFINEEPFVVSDSDNLSIKLLQKNEAKKSVPIHELAVLIDFVSLVAPHTANFLLRANDIVKDPVTQNYLNMMDEAFKKGDLDGTKSRDFTTNIAAIKVKLNVPQEKSIQGLGYILLKPKYRKTLTTVDTINGIPNFMAIDKTLDHRIKDLMNYRLKGKNISLRTVVDNFRQVSNEHVIEALSLLNTDLMNRFTRYDRALILSLALRQSDLYRYLKQSVQNDDVEKIKLYMNILDEKQNPLQQLNRELNDTHCEYYNLRKKAHELLNKYAIKNIKLRRLENFLRPVSNSNYIPKMFVDDAKIEETTGRILNISQLQQTYQRESNVTAYGCYIDLQSSINGDTIQDYLISPTYTEGEKYDYMALSVDKSNRVDTIFYKLTPKIPYKIEKMLIDKGRFIGKETLQAVLKYEKPRKCSIKIVP